MGTAGISGKATIPDSPWEHACIELGCRNGSLALENNILLTSKLVVPNLFSLKPSKGSRKTPQLSAFAQFFDSVKILEQFFWCKELSGPTAGQDGLNAADSCLKPVGLSCESCLRTSQR